ncbi:MAG TPA: alpha-amylase family glycosyl hydrolase, partial [Rhodothermales bacterium]
QPVTVFFDATQGSGGLAGFTGDVYAHTGVITNLSTQPSDWKHVKTNWGQNTPETKLERIGPDLYQLHIADIRSYYGVPASEQVLQLAFVFRSADASREGKDAGNADIFVDIHDGSLQATFLGPGFDPLYPPIFTRDTTITVIAIAAGGSGPRTTSLLVDGVVVSTTASDTIRYDLTLDAPGTRWDLTVEAVDATDAADSESIYLVRNPETPPAARPEGVRDGITLQQPNEAVFSLYAPGKEFVYLVGDFTDWEVDPAYFLTRHEAGPDSVHFWTSVGGLSQDVLYRFQYLVDGEIRFADPYAPLILDAANDGSISSSTYPGLPAYPTGDAEHMVGAFTIESAPYPWQVPDFEAPAQKDLVIYELLLRDFLAAHDWDTLTDTLDYLDRLGINAIELMPIQEFDGNLSWGYNPAFYFAPDKYYGPANDLKRFIDEAHARGIAVILDVVYNHVTGQSPFVRLFNEGDYGPATDDNPWVNREARHPFNVFNDINHESTGTRYFLDRANEYWLTEFNVDGFRYDLSKGFTQTFYASVNAWGQYDAGRVATLKRMADAVWSVKPNAYIILEHFGGLQEERELTEYRTGEGLPGMMVWSNMNRAYSQSAMGYLSDTGFVSDLGPTYYRNRGFNVPNVVTYMESHDEQWLMYRNRAYGPSAGDYDVKDLATSLDRMKLVGAFFFTVPGPRMIWQFGELGYGYGQNECLMNDGSNECPSGVPGRTDQKPIRWQYRNDPLREKLYKTWSALIRLRNDHEVFTSTDTEVTMDVGQGRRVRSIRLSHPTMDAVVFGNFDIIPQTVQPSFLTAGTWFDYFSGASVEIADPAAPITLLPGEFHVYTSQFVEPPEPGLITVDVESEVAELPRETLLEANYPNPFNPTTRIAYAVREAGPVRLEVFDLLGRRVRVLVDDVQPAGWHAVMMDASGLASGTYVYRLNAGGDVHVRKMVLAR